MLIKIVPKKESTEVTSIKLTRKTVNTESIIYAISKKMKNNPCKIASAKLTNGFQVDVLVINNLKIKNKKGRYIVDTSKKEINQDKPLHKYRKYLYSPDYEVVSEPTLLLNVNQKNILTYAISDLLDIEYTKSSIKKFISSEIKKFDVLRKSTDTAK